jgi:hypothetical protein
MHQNGIGMQSTVHRRKYVACKERGKVYEHRTGIQGDKKDEGVGTKENFYNKYYLSARN